MYSICYRAVLESSGTTVSFQLQMILMEANMEGAKLQSKLRNLCKLLTVVNSWEFPKLCTSSGNSRSVGAKGSVQVSRETDFSRRSAISFL